MNHAYREPGKTAPKVIFQIRIFFRVPESRVIGEHFGLLFGSGTRDLAELWRTKTRMPWISSLVSLYGIFPLENYIHPILIFAIKTNRAQSVFLTQ